MIEGVLVAPMIDNDDMEPVLCAKDSAEYFSVVMKQADGSVRWFADFADEDQANHYANFIANEHKTNRLATSHSETLQ